MGGNGIRKVLPGTGNEDIFSTPGVSGLHTRRS